MNRERKTVFISYAWDNQEHQDWVQTLASDLITTYGVDIILDQYELSAGKDLTYFMESSIEKSDKVLVILTPNYKLKAEKRTNGVGYETSMISQEIFESPVSSVKFIPILRDGDIKTSSPKFLKSKLYHPMTDNTQYQYQLFDLAKVIYDKSLIEKPSIGDIPDFSDSNADPIIAIANELSSEEKINNKIDSILKSKDGVDLAIEEFKGLRTTFQQKCRHYSDNTDLQFSYNESREAVIINCENYSFRLIWHLEYSNSLSQSQLTVENWNGYLSIGGRNIHRPGSEPKLKGRSKYTFDLDYNHKPIWKSSGSKKTSAEIVQRAFIYLIDRVREEKTKNFRN